LEKKLNPAGGEPMRFLDIAVPVKDHNGATIGVLGAHIDWQWIKDIRTSSPYKRSEVILVDLKNTVLYGPPDVQGTTLSLKSVPLARNGETGFLIEHWPNGKTYISGFSKSRGYGNYPGLGWVVVERQETEDAFAPVTDMQNQLLMLGFIFAGIFALIGVWIAARIARPLNSITNVMELIERGEKAAIPIPKSTYREATFLARSLHRLITSLTEREAQLAHQATHHPLTQLPNRALLKEVLSQTIARAKVNHATIAVLTIKLDRLKTVNEGYGHDVGDMILREAAQRIASCTEANGMLGHLGEDRFTILLEDNDRTMLRISTLTSQLMQTMAKSFRSGEHDIFIKASIGISLYPKDTDNPEALLGYSSMAAQEAEKQGGNRIKFYQSEMNRTVLVWLDLDRELHRAVETGQFELHYQPQLSLVTGTIVGVEALIRWRHPDRGLISPADFIPVAEANGLIVAIGDWVLRQACAQSRIWRTIGLPPMRIGINISGQQFTAGDLVHKVATAIRANGLAPDSLKLEITESLLMEDIEENIKAMHKLRQLGVHLAIDDFGTGYSSLAYLKRFPINELKIDQTFIRQMTPDSQDAAIVRTIVALGHNLRMSVIAEGVETKEQIQYLRQIGCNEIQGYYFSRPVPPEKIPEFFKKHDRITSLNRISALQ
jgi:diguanylate cyclase (GGDEF)-like protein